MAQLDYKDIYTKLGKRTEWYALAVRDTFQKRIGEIIAMCEGLELEDGKPFAFADYDIAPAVQKKLRQLYSEVYKQVRGSVVREWNYANDTTDRLVKGLFGKKSIEDKHYARYFQRNKAAMDSFFTRTQDGLNLSQRVWRYVGQAKTDLEVALDLGLGQGLDAGDLSRKVREYLNNPDDLFRRFRYKKGEDENGNPIYGRKWKRRMYDKDTKSFYWVDDNPKNYHTGQGVYRSSYKNAMRLTRTEANMAYRAADITRWQQLDFICGYEVKLSKNHPCTDICDALAGKYPKDFMFKGWHPHCYCYIVPILCTESELEQLQEQILKGEDTSNFVPADVVQAVPQGFTGWIADNKHRISSATSLPYFISDNYKGGDISRGFKWISDKPKKLSVWDIAKQRHAKRDDKAIQAAWDERRAYNKAKVVANNVLMAADKPLWHKLGIDTSVLQQALQDGSTAAEVKAKTQELAKAMAQERKAYNKAVKVAGNIVNAASKGHYDLLGIDTANLQNIIATGKATEISDAAKALAKDMAAAKKLAKQEYSDHPTMWGLVNEFGEAEANAFLANWGKHMAKSSIYTTDEQFLAKVIQKELYYAKLNPNKYTTTPKFIEFFEKLEQQYQTKIAIGKIQGDIDAVIAFAQTTKSAKVKQMANELINLTGVSNPNEAAIKAKLAEVQKEVDRLTKARIARMSKNGTGYDIEAFYSAADKAKRDKLVFEYEKALTAAMGNERDYDVIAAMQRLADFTIELGERYAKVQPTLVNVDGLTEAQVKQAIKDYFSHSKINPTAPSEPWGIWSKAIGGENWFGKEARCKELAKEIAAMGGSVTARELSLITNFTQSSNFICDYLYGASKVSLITDAAVKADIEKLLQNFKAAINHAIEGMPRYNGITYRGLNIYPQAFADPSKDAFWDSIMKAWNSKDKTWSMVAPTSTTTSIRTADNFADGIVHKSKGQRVILKIHGKTGVDIHKIGYFGGGESEITFRAGSKFRLLKAPYKCTGRGLGKAGDWCVELEEII